MKNKKLIYLFAFSLSIIFSIFYLFLFQLYNPSKNIEPMNLYLNQVGLYKEEGNAKRVKEELKAHDIPSYIYKNKDVYVVVSGVSDQKEINTQNGEQLKNLSYSYLMKSVKIQDEKIASLWEKKEIQQVLELIANQSQGDPS